MLRQSEKLLDNLDEPEGLPPTEELPADEGQESTVQGEDASNGSKLDQNDTATARTEESKKQDTSMASAASRASKAVEEVM